MTVRIYFTSTKTLFTQRGKDPKRGFVRVNGKTITGTTRVNMHNEQIFEPAQDLLNADAIWTN